MTIDILRKLTSEIQKGISTEVQVVYLLAGVRKLLERDRVTATFPDLKFHCDWVLHAQMSYSGAQKILAQFDAAHPLLRKGVELHDLPSRLEGEIDRISQMRSFKKELVRFLKEYELPPLTLHREDGWAHFLHLYARVIEDIPLMVVLPTPEGSAKKRVKQKKQTEALKNITHVTVHCELAWKPVSSPEGEDQLFKITWRSHDKNEIGKSGDIFVVNSFEL